MTESGRQLAASRYARFATAGSNDLAPRLPASCLTLHHSLPTLPAGHESIDLHSPTSEEPRFPSPSFPLVFATNSHSAAALKPTTCPRCPRSSQHWISYLACNIACWPDQNLTCSLRPPIASRCSCLRKPTRLPTLGSSVFSETPSSQPLVFLYYGNQTHYICTTTEFGHATHIRSQ